MDAFEALTRADEPLPEARHLTVELVFAELRSPVAVAARIGAALPDSRATVESAFGRSEDRFLFVSFPDVPAAGQEARAFAFARALGAETGAAEANPVLRDSLYGTWAVGGAAEESLLSACETDRTNL